MLALAFVLCWVYAWAGSRRPTDAADRDQGKDSFPIWRPMIASLAVLWFVEAGRLPVRSTLADPAAFVAALIGVSMAGVTLGVFGRRRPGGRNVSGDRGKVN